jgi:hypothetical protein
VRAATRKGIEQLSEETISCLLFLFVLLLGLLIFFLKPLSLSVPGQFPFILCSDLSPLEVLYPDL